MIKKAKADHKHKHKNAVFKPPFDRTKVDMSAVKEDRKYFYS